MIMVRMGDGVGETGGAGRRAACLDVIKGLSWETVLEQVRMGDLTAILGGTNIIDKYNIRLSHVTMTK